MARRRRSKGLVEEFDSFSVQKHFLNNPKEKKMANVLFIRICSGLPRILHSVSQSLKEWFLHPPTLLPAEVDSNECRASLLFSQNKKSNSMAGKSIENISLRDSINYLDSPRVHEPLHSLPISLIRGYSGV